MSRFLFPPELGLRAAALTLALTGACAPASAEPPADTSVTVYRCTDAQGRVSLGDEPCPPGQTEQSRDMRRPVDPPPAQAPTPAPEPAVAAKEPVRPQVVVVRTPQPMYRCVRPDGSSYTSDSSEGNPRWVPLWTLGYGPPRRSSGHAEVSVDTGHGSARVELGGGGRGRHHPRGGFGGAGTWVRDECHAMPQGEVCGLLRDRRDEIRRRFFNAQPTERGELNTEERAINARLDQDCNH